MRVHQEKETTFDRGFLLKERGLQEVSDTTMSVNNCDTYEIIGEGKHIVVLYKKTDGFFRSFKKYRASS